ncbi:TetR/AcrR family transcriptional regulator [Cellulomonas sp. P22]|uniref:TetR/AcrR family transcriptional regulator n=1 Tax=Cellulomonas sp. P22 TaxID=3373189 RepID=UPI0037B17175
MTEPPVRRRRRAEELQAEIRQAVRAELYERGYAGVTYEGVARRVGTSKPVLYRRYGSRAVMVLDALVLPDAEPLPIAPCGPFVQDFAALVGVVTDRFGPASVKTFLGLMAEADDDTVARATEQMFGVVERWLAQIVDEARLRGELGPRPVPRHVLGAVLSLVRGEVLFARSTRRDVDIDRLAGDVILPLLRVTTTPA